MSDFFKKLFGKLDDVQNDVQSYVEPVAQSYTLEQIEALLQLTTGGDLASHISIVEKKAANFAKREENLNADASGIETVAQYAFDEATSSAREALKAKLTQAEGIRDQAIEAGENAEKARGLLAVFAKQ